MVAPTPDSVIFRRDWRRELVRLNADTAARLLSAYQRTLPRIQQAAGELTDQLTELAGRDLASISAADLRGLSTYQRLLVRVETEMRDFAVIIRNEAANAQDDGIQLGLDAAADMVGSQVGPLEAQIMAAFNRPDPAAIQRLVGYVDGTAMQQRFAAFGESAAQNLADVLLTGVAQGKNPRAIAALISNWYSLPYAWAENMTRTVQNWSYRTASHAAYAANPDIVTGWMWWASLDDRTCLSCWGQHGSTHDAREVLNDHHRGRCTPLPIVRGTRWADDVQRGQDRFAELDAERQRRIMGNAMHRAWTAGAVQWGDFSRPYNDGVYGQMLRASSLKDILGDEAQRYYSTP